MYKYMHWALHAPIGHQKLFVLLKGWKNIVVGVNSLVGNDSSHINSCRRNQIANNNAKINVHSFSDDSLSYVARQI